MSNSRAFSELGTTITITMLDKYCNCLKCAKRKYYCMVNVTNEQHQAGNLFRAELTIDQISESLERQTASFQELSLD